MVTRVLAAAQRTLARIPGAVRLMVKVRNQASSVIRNHLGDDANPLVSGETWLARVVAPSASTIIDVGANVGEWSSLFLASMRGAPKAFLYEPSAGAAAHLRNRFEHQPEVTIVEAAVSDSLGNAQFFEEPEAGKTSSLLAGFSAFGARGKPVRVTTLDAEADSHDFGYVDFLKVDAEGFDLHVLRGAANLLSSRRIGIVQFEYNAPWARAGSTLAAAYALLESSGYKVFLLKPTGLFELNYNLYGEYFSYSNFVAIAPEWLSSLRAHIRGAA